MKISVEITLLPLQNAYETPIKEFIKTLRNSEFEVLENPLSTQIYGEYVKLMPFLQSAIEKSFKNLDAAVLNLKIVKGDRSTYAPNF